MSRSGDPLWAYRYRLDGRGSRRPQVGGFATRAKAQRALRRELARLRPGGRAATITLGELVDEYLDVHQAAPATIEKLRWLLAKATGALGMIRLAELRSEAICAWQRTLPQGHRFEATQAVRQVLNRAIAWELIEANPATRGVDNPLRRFAEKRPFESWAEIEAVAAELGRVYGPMVVFAAATGLRPAELFALEHRDLDYADGVVHVRRAYANGRVINTKTTRSTRAVPLPTKALAALERLPKSDSPTAVPGTARGPRRAAQLPPPALAARAGRSRDRSDPPRLRPPAHLRHLRAPRGGPDLRPLPIYGRQPGDDRPPLRPPRPRRPPARDRAPRRVHRPRQRVDVRWTSQRTPGTCFATALMTETCSRPSARWTFRGRRHA
jgi:integrase